MTKRGTTLIELMVAMLVFSLLTTILVAIFERGTSAFRLGSGTVDLTRQSRIAMERITPYLVTAMNPVSTQDAVYSPGPGSAATNTVVFCTTQDFLASNPPDYNARSPQYYLYQIRLTDPVVVAPEGTLNSAYTNYSLVLERLAPPHPSLGPWTVDASVPARLLSRNVVPPQLNGLATGVFQRVRQGGIRVSLSAQTRIKGAREQLRSINFQLDTRIDFPCYSL